MEAVTNSLSFELLFQDGQECGGAYLKLLSSGKETTDLLKVEEFEYFPLLQQLKFCFSRPTQFNDKTPYTIMFGPDKCGNDIKLHFIFRHKNPRNGTITEKHCKKSK